VGVPCIMHLLGFDDFASLFTLLMLLLSISSQLPKRHSSSLVVEQKVRKKGKWMGREDVVKWWHAEKCAIFFPDFFGGRDLTWCEGPSRWKPKQ